ncbi:MAG: hypothetical protein JST21_14455 [Bacteroidetes bacterium]|nr:hypothetical protein [Bacteroidota bacterium]
MKKVVCSLSTVNLLLYFSADYQDENPATTVKVAATNAANNYIDGYLL